MLLKLAPSHTGDQQCTTGSQSRLAKSKMLALHMRVQNGFRSDARVAARLAVLSCQCADMDVGLASGLLWTCGCLVRDSRCMRECEWMRSSRRRPRTCRNSCHARMLPRTRSVRKACRVMLSPPVMPLTRETAQSLLCLLPCGCI